MSKAVVTSKDTLDRLPLLERIDVGLVELARPALESPLVRKIGDLGRIGDDKLLLLVSLGVTAAGLASRNGKLQRTGFRMLLAQLAAKAAKEFGKNAIDRTRPETQIETGHYVAKAGTSSSAALRSFPSGHTASALAVAKAFSREYPRYTKPVLTAASLIAVLQVPRRANYPGDVAAGAGAGFMAEKVADALIAGVEKVRAHVPAFSPPLVPA